MRLGHRHLRLPLLQGGMGIGVSLSKLAGAVAREGAMGVISAINPGYREADFESDNLAANRRALAKEIHEARKIADGQGLIGVNIMCAISQYKEMVETAAKAGADALICGAGLPLNLPELVPSREILLAPIVSSARAARLIAETWWRRYERYPDFLVLEGPLAGGHLGFKWPELEATAKTLKDLLRELVAWRDTFREENQHELPIFAAGGIRSAEERRELMDLGADGIQLGTPFIATEECDAPAAMKEALIAASDEDIRLIQSPVGLPGRALFSPLLKKLEEVPRIPPRHCVKCLKTCDPKTTKYCINEALQAAIRGDRENGLFFSGAKIGGIRRLTSVRERIREFFPEYYGDTDDERE